MNDTNLQSGDYLWGRTGATDPLVLELEQALAPLAFRGQLPREIKRATNWRMLRAAAALVLLVLGAAWFAQRPRPVAWQVVTLRGQPQIDSSSDDAQVLRVGNWLTTDDHSQARLAVANIGHVTVQPNTRLRLIASGTSISGASPEHRLELARGAIHAFITAPPRLFVVDTRAAVAVDYGCAYSLEIDDNGLGLLSVEQGLVLLEGHGRSAMVPMNAMCRMQEGFGPGTPFSDHASPKLREALDVLDFQSDGGGALEVAIAECTNLDTVTLWHLLEGTDGDRRRLIVERLAQFVPLPDGVTIENILADDSRAMERWHAEVQRYW